MSKLEKRVIDLEYTTYNLQHELAMHKLNKQVERTLLTKIACGVTGHTFQLESAFINREDNNWICGRFTCTNCFLKVVRRLTDKEKDAAKQLGML